MHIPPPIQVLISSVEISSDGRVTCSLEEFRNLVRMAVVGIPVDEAWYTDTYKDVAAAISKGTVSSASEHYAHSGYLDGRFPFQPVVEQVWYYENNEDLHDSRGEVRSAAQHLQDAGYQEGRVPHRPVIDRVWYSQCYAEAKRQVDEGRFPSLEAHFVEAGYRKGFFPVNPFAVRLLST